jgi:hypothetical protein
MKTTLVYKPSVVILANPIQECIRAISISDWSKSVKNVSKINGWFIFVVLSMNSMGNALDIYILIGLMFYQ